MCRMLLRRSTKCQPTDNVARQAHALPKYWTVQPDSHGTPSMNLTYAKHIVSEKEWSGLPGKDCMI